jgi:hypothetical protein
MTKKILLILVFISLSSCRLPETLGFYQPITMNVRVPDGPPEYKAGWYSGCKSAMANKAFANSFVYQDGKGPDMGSGVYQHDSAFQTGWGQGWFACILHISQFVNYNAMMHGPLQ